MAGDTRARSTQILGSSGISKSKAKNRTNYFFVGNHNRHKGLNVTRACEGCRKRKIKCDAATTNTWPCSACIRLQLHCVPPSINQDASSNPQAYKRQVNHESVESGGDKSHQWQMADQHKDTSPIYTPQIPRPNPEEVFYPGPPSSDHIQCVMNYNDNSIQTAINQNQYSHGVLLLHRQQQYSSSPNAPETYEQGQYGRQDLANLLGDLRIDETGTAPYLNNRGVKDLVEEPAFGDVDEYKDIILFALDLQLKIPPELMPDNETALYYFDLYFMNVHPYVPVINKTLFYQQWHTNREAISPVILEAIFAIAGRLADNPAQGQQWLALASKHADSLMDVPRLSTLQAMLILLKARESAPKRGYYFRSWMTVVLCVQMAKDLGLDEHFEEHKAGRSCGSELAGCITKTRIWQTVFVSELMIGASQGRTDLSVGIESVDLRMPCPLIGCDEGEFYNTRSFAYFSQVALNIGQLNTVSSRVKRKNKWGIDPEVVQLNPSFESWLNNLPTDLQITFPPDGSPPWLPSHFIGNMHSYYYLSIIILHRPQLTFMDPTNMDGGWKHHMTICYSSAKCLCRLQEAILKIFGIKGLLCMQRGINFTIYCVLTCTALYLVALTSPDPDLWSDAPHYFTRHMRILEICYKYWPMPDMQHQIDAFREVFSVDMSKPFVLKPTFLYGNPGALVNTTPPRPGMDTGSRTVQPLGMTATGQRSP